MVVVVLLTRSHSTLPRRQVSAFLTAWSRGDTTAMAALIDAPPPDLAARAGSLTKSASGATASYTITRLTRSRAGYHAHVVLPGFGALDWDGSFGLVGGRVHWADDALYPGLAAGQRLALHRSWPARADILGADGTPMVSAQPAVIVGLEPDHITNLAQVQAVLSSSLGVAPGAVQAALGAPGVRPNFFVPIDTIPDSRYTALRPQLAPVPGILFRRTSARLAAAGGQVVGAVGDVTAERLAQLGAPYRVGDQVGLTGLEAVFEKRLAGSPDGEVDVTDASGAVVRPVQHYAGTAPQPVQVTLDLRTQLAAQSALSGVSGAAALVALDTTTGAIKAVVSTPTTEPFDRALDGSYPPGSTFKVITTAALLAAGRTGATPAACPPHLTVDGRVFSNFEGEAPGSIPLSRAFAISCNTAFVGLADQLPAGAIGAAAASFGFGQTFSLPLAAVGGKYPTPADRVEAAASAIGQGRVTASPLQMATVAATVAVGQWHAPFLVTPPAPSTVAPLDAGIATTLRSMMRDVVLAGTGTAAAVPGQQIFGKTGTAEFGSATPPSTHAWFIGFRGGLAFAVLVEGGGVGGRVAAPLAAKFLAAAPA